MFRTMTVVDAAGETVGWLDDCRGLLNLAKDRFTTHVTVPVWLPHVDVRRILSLRVIRNVHSVIIAFGVREEELWLLRHTPGFMEKANGRLDSVSRPKNPCWCETCDGNC